jgi:ATP-dependent Clp protease adaptor protein ClpS
MSDPKSRPERDGDVAVDTRTEKKLKAPSLYRVVLLNDDYTTMEFVVAVLRHVFHHTEETAHAIMLHIHEHGRGVAGVYTFEVAETKSAHVLDLAHKAEFPLQCVVEPE